MVANENREGYKKTELGWIPEYWNVVELKSVCTEFNVPMRDKPKVFDGNVPWCRIEDIQGRYIYGTTSEQYVSAETITDMNLKINPKGSIICSCSASLGVVAMVENPLITNQTFIGIVLKDSICREYLYYYLLSCKQRFKRIAGGTTIPYISREKFENFKIVYPSIMEQEKVGRILNTVDLTIEEIDKKLFALTELKRALAKKVLTEGIGHTEFKETEIGQLPLSWKVISINELSEKIVGGGTPSRDVKEYFEGNIPWATVKDMDDSIMKSTTTEYITDLAVQNSSARVIDAYNIIVSTRMGLGRGFINTVNMAINQDLKGIFLKKDIVLTEYFLYYFKFLATKIESMGKGSTVKGIVLDELKKIYVAIPDIQEQKQIVQILNSVDGMISSYNDQKSDYTQLKAG